MNLPISRLDLLDCRRNSFVLEPNHSSCICSEKNSLIKAGALFDGKFSPYLEKQGCILHWIWVVILSLPLPVTLGVSLLPF